MSEPPTLEYLLDCSQAAFESIDRIVKYFEKDREQWKLGQHDPAARHRYLDAIKRLSDEMPPIGDAVKTPPEGFTTVGEYLRRAGDNILKIRDTLRSAESWRYREYVHHMPDLITAIEGGMRAIADAREARCPRVLVAGDPLHLSPAKMKPEAPRPPQAVIDSAAGAVPEILANVQEIGSTCSEMRASVLEKRLQERGHPIAAILWAIHGLATNGMLTVRFGEVELPQIGPGPAWKLPPGNQHRRALSPTDIRVTGGDELWEWWRENVVDPATVPAAGDDPASGATPAEATTEQPKRKPVTVSPSERVKLFGMAERPVIDCVEMEPLTEVRYCVVKAILDAPNGRLKTKELIDNSGKADAVKRLKDVRKLDEKWAEVIILPGKGGQGSGYRIL